MADKKNQLLKYQNITNGDMSLSSITSTITNISFLDDIGVQFNFSGAPVGTLAIQVSADHAQDYSSPPNVTVAGNWVNLVFTYWNGTAFVTDTSIPTSVGSPVYIDLALLSSPWIRAVYTKTSGSGTLQAFITGKAVS